MFCRQCGQEQNEDAKHCSNCGKTLRDSFVTRILTNESFRWSGALLVIFIVVLGVIANYFTRNIKSKDLEASEIATISRSIVDIRCSQSEGEEYWGSGSLVTIASDYNSRFSSEKTLVVTNAHVTGTTDDTVKCEARFTNKGTTSIATLSNKAESRVYDEQGDVDVALLTTKDIQNKGKALAINHSMKVCKESSLVSGVKIYIFGYPSSAEEENKRNLVVSEGIISGKRKNSYYTSAQIDLGNSGGLAVAKINGQVCIVGIPTWVSVGEAQILGLIQPFNNILDGRMSWDF